MKSLFEKLWGNRKPTNTDGKKSVNKSSDISVGSIPSQFAPVNVQKEQNPSGRRRVEVQPPKDSSNVYVGLDFGTAFTKVAYEIAPSNEHKKYSIKFFDTKKQDDYLKPSVLYFDANRARLLINNNSKNTQKLEYFKLLMINDALPRNTVLNSEKYKTNNDKEQLCSAFYLSHIIALTKEAIKKNPAAHNVTQSSKWYVNMGIPIESDTEKEQIRIFKSVLNVAWAYANDNPNTDSVDLYSFDNYFSENKDNALDSLNIYPELFAEVLLYQQDPNIPNGFYTVVDIGGGTADIATFYKYKPTRNSSKVECLQKRVVWLGFDSLAGKVIANKEGTDLDKVKTLLNNSTIGFNDNNLSAFTQNSIINRHNLLECRKEFRSAYGTCVMSTKDLRPDQMDKDFSQKKDMKLFPLGGAGHVAFYEQAIDHMREAQKQARIPYANETEILWYLNNNVTLEIKNNRLLISQMLAQPFERIPEIANMSWIKPERKIRNKGKSQEELAELQEQLYPK